ncbi:expressed unknown protein [Seminavis robusta]|uniref:Uncharacterized protein n=1 Tax=Seminavis robusta TaxID=568900 RepID=A0A9N8H605_9STRA|nr:expressed unknown protein [Seminavis robusta]|eukprot:Sro34_g021860.1 n/a (345) ;mRNA; r:24182-25216
MPKTRGARSDTLFWTVVASPLFVLLVTLPWILAAPVSVIIGLLFCFETASTSNSTGKQCYERSTDDNEQKVIEDRDINNASWRSNETASTGDSTGTQWYQRSKDSRGGGSPSTRTSSHRDLACIFKFAMERLVVVPTLVLFSFPLCVLLYCRIVLQMLKGTTWPNNDNDSDRDWKQEEHWDYHWDYTGDWDEVLLDLMKLGNQFYDQQILNNLRCWYHIHLRFYTLLGATWSGHLVDTAMTPLFLTRLLVCIVLSLPIAVLYTAKILLYYARQVMNALPGRLLQDAFTLAFGSLVGRYLRTIIVQLPLLLGTMLVLSSMFLPLLPVTYIAVIRMAMHYERYRSS